MDKIKFVASYYFSITANINKACLHYECDIKNYKKRLSYLRARLYIVEGHSFHTFVP